MDKAVTIVVPNVLGKGLTGPAIRCLEMARVLAARYPVVLAVNRHPDVEIPAGVTLRICDQRELTSVVRSSPLVISQGLDYRARDIAGLGSIQVFDLYNLILLEAFAGHVHAQTMSSEHQRYLAALTRLLLRRGAYFLCATPHQRDFWLGSLLALGRLTQEQYLRKPDGSSLIGLVPFGHSGDLPVKTGPVIKGVLQGIGAQDRLLIWGGGLWNWFDPHTLLRAMHALADRRPDIKLLFMGVRHPSAEFNDYQMALAARSCAEQLGLAGRTVFFNDQWIAYDRRGEYLLEADLAVCTAPAGLENHFSFRTRLMDALWARLPYVCTEGGFFPDLALREGVGYSVPAGDEPALAQAIERALEPKEAERCRQNIDRIRPNFQWDRCLRPLVDFCDRAFDNPEDVAAPGHAWLDYSRYLASGKMPRRFLG